MNVMFGIEWSKSAADDGRGVVQPRWGCGLGGWRWSQGALRDPGLWCGTPLAFGSR